MNVNKRLLFYFIFFVFCLLGIPNLTYAKKLPANGKSVRAYYDGNFRKDARIKSQTANKTVIEITTYNYTGQPWTANEVYYVSSKKGEYKWAGQCNKYQNNVWASPVKCTLTIYGSGGKTYTIHEENRYFGTSLYAGTTSYQITLPKKTYKTPTPKPSKTPTKTSTPTPTPTPSSPSIVCEEEEKTVTDKVAASGNGNDGINTSCDDSGKPKTLTLPGSITQKIESVCRQGDDIKSSTELCSKKCVKKATLTFPDRPGTYLAGTHFTWDKVKIEVKNECTFTGNTAKCKESFGDGSGSVDDAVSLSTTYGDPTYGKNKKFEYSTKNGDNTTFYMPDGMYRYVQKGTGKSISSTEEKAYSAAKKDTQGNLYIDIGYSNYPIDYTVNTGTYDFIANYKIGEYNGKYSCNYNVINKLFPEKNGDINVVYRPISLSQPFLKNDGSPRTPNGIWNVDNNSSMLTEKYITKNREVMTDAIYKSKTPLYSIFLDRGKMTMIKEKANNYDDFDLKCKNGKECVSDYLRELEGISGSCIDTNSGFYRCADKDDQIEMNKDIKCYLNDGKYTCVDCNKKGNSDIEVCKRSKKG